MAQISVLPGEVEPMYDGRMAEEQPVSQNPEKPTEEWVTRDEPMTGPQLSYLKSLAREAGVEIDEGMTKAQASEKIEELQRQTGRGKPR